MRQRTRALSILRGGRGEVLKASHHLVTSAAPSSVEGANADNGLANFPFNVKIVHTCLVSLSTFTRGTRRGEKRRPSLKAMPLRGMQEIQVIRGWVHIYIRKSSSFVDPTERTRLVLEAA